MIDSTNPQSCTCYLCFLLESYPDFCLGSGKEVCPSGADCKAVQPHFPESLGRVQERALTCENQLQGQ